ncbi:hypothetical protein RDWZM_000693 [Blomia tropicalis]|uniref:39S ribosomal protein L34, mitochondrial n=1 Tax=Blomia tropicalis TaxID=40697 RepID=A0A9Q0MBF0_BLOTA|nr:hypothetical protein RDWZM_000693 [Blomia tropicalis]
MNALRPALFSITSQLTPVRSVLFDQVRGNVKWFFERCSEVKRIRKHGYKKRISTPNGRLILMRRILKVNDLFA